MLVPSNQPLRKRSRARQPLVNLSQGPLFAAIFLLCAVLSALLAALPFLTSSAIVVGIAVFILCFVSTELSVYLLIFSMLLSPEFGLGALSGGDTTASRGVTIRTEDLLLLLMGFAWLARMAVHKDLGLVRETPINKPIVNYVFICLFATTMGLIFGYVKGVTGFFFVLKYIEYFVLYFVVANNIHTRSQIKRYLVVLLATAFIVSLVSMAQIPTGQRVSAPFEGEHGEPNTLGGYLLFIGALAGGLAMNLRRERYKRLLLLLLLLMFVPFLATLSRGSYLGLPFVYVALVTLRGRNRVLMIALMVGALALGMALMPQVVKDRISYTFTQKTQAERVALGGIKLDTSTSARLHSWEEALGNISRSPVWGFGVTGYGFLDAQYPRTLVETGLVGLWLFFALVYAVFKQALHTFRKSQDALYRGVAMGLSAGLVGLLVHGIGANTFIIVRIMEPFWLVVGLVVSAAKLEGLESLAGGGPQGSEKPPAALSPSSLRRSPPGSSL